MLSIGGPRNRRAFSMRERAIDGYKAVESSRDAGRCSSDLVGLDEDLPSTCLVQTKVASHRGTFSQVSETMNAL